MMEIRSQLWKSGREWNTSQYIPDPQKQNKNITKEENLSRVIIQKGGEVECVMRILFATLARDRKSY